MIRFEGRERRFGSAGKGASERLRLKTLNSKKRDGSTNPLAGMLACMLVSWGWAAVSPPLGFGELLDSLRFCKGLEMLQIQRVYPIRVGKFRAL
jgi:hypothetical protein